MPWVLPTVMHILPASGQLRIYPYICLPFRYALPFVPWVSPTVMHIKPLWGFNG
ncbi:MAG: hypothetical protein FWD49_06065 [Firmicutes bacterium]|nr:hypothetical protein [Bacillota bacterium]